jgi:pyruvate dehydrogenase E1 component beta subunit
VAGEIIALVAEHAFDVLAAPPRRVTWPESAVPSSERLEAMFYPGAEQIADAASSVCEKRVESATESIVKSFDGPF